MERKITLKKNPRSLKTKKLKIKTERFTLLREKLGYWKVSGRDSDGKYRRIRFEATDIDEANKLANYHLFGLDPTKNNLPDDHPKLRISDALIKAAETREWSSYTRLKDEFNCEYFLQWCDRKNLRYWHELRYEHVLIYKRELIKRGLKFDSVRLYLLPIRRTAAWISANWPNHYVNITHSLRLSKNEFYTKTYSDEEGNPYISIPRVLDFLDWLSRKPNKHQLIVGIALQGLVGLQLLEVLRLKWEKIDLKQGTIIIDGEVKNRYRVRKIPLPNVLIWILNLYFNSVKSSDYLLHDFNHHDPYSHAVKRELHRWDPRVNIKPKDLRNTIQTAAIDGGWYSYYVQRYVGHAPTTIGEKHYFGDQGKRLIPLYREKVVAKIEEEISQWKSPHDTVIIPGPRLVVNR